MDFAENANSPVVVSFAYNHGLPYSLMIVMYKERATAYLQEDGIIQIEQ